MSGEQHPKVLFWEAFPGERIAAADYESILVDAGVRKVCVSLIPGRCGSTLFGEMVAQWGCFGKGTEAFNERPREKWLRHAGSGREFLSWVIRHRAAGGVFWFQAAPHRHDHLLTGLDPAIPRDWRYSVILRRNIVAQAMSYVYAIGSQVWHSSCPGFDPSTPLDLPGKVDLLADQVLDWVSQLVRYEDRIRAILDERGDERTLVLFYEDIICDPREAVSRFYRDAGVAPPLDPPPFRQTLSRLRKRNEAQLRECVLARHGDEVRRIENAREAGILAWAAKIGLTAGPIPTADSPQSTQVPSCSWADAIPPDREGQK